MRVDIRLYVLLDADVAGNRSLPDLALQAAAGGATLLQYRDKTTDTKTAVARARAILASLEGAGIPLLINDRVDVALTSGAQGVHLGQSDMLASDARALLGPDAVIGRTVTVQAHAQGLIREPIDYAFIGGVFRTTSKINQDPPKGVAGFLHLLQKAHLACPVLPIGAIAGLNASNAAEVIAAGADGIAVASSVIGADDPSQAARILRTIVDAALQARPVKVS